MANTKNTKKDDDVQRRPTEPMAWAKPGTIMKALQNLGLLEVRSSRDIRADANRHLKISREEGRGVFFHRRNPN